MVRSWVLGAALVAAVTGCSITGGDKGSDENPPRPTSCSAASATPATRVTVSKTGLDLSCVSVVRKAGFTLLNVDTRLHDFSTTKGAPTPLRVELKKGAAFPYRFTKAGTYRLQDTKSDLVLTIIVR